MSRDHSCKYNVTLFRLLRDLRILACVYPILCWGGLRWHYQLLLANHRLKVGSSTCTAQVEACTRDHLLIAVFSEAASIFVAELI